MTKKLLWILAAVALSLAGCGDDKGGKDKGITLPDKGKTDGQVTKQDTGGLPPDQNVTKKDTGTVTGNYGAKCSQTKACPETSMMCAGTSATTTFCTKECPVADFKTNADCSGGPAGTKFICALADSLTNPTRAMCAFICQVKDASGKTVTWPCPTELKCGTPDANGGAFCE